MTSDDASVTDDSDTDKVDRPGHSQRGDGLPASPKKNIARRESAAMGKATVPGRKKLATRRKDVITRREIAADLREDTVSRREETATLREHVIHEMDSGQTQREDAVG